MRMICFVVLTLGFLAGCGEPPAAVGPAAEASTDDIQITMESPNTTATTGQAGTGTP